MKNVMIAVKPATLTLAMVAFLTLQASAQRADITYINSRGDQKTDSNAQISEWTYKDIQFKGRTRRTITVDKLISVKFRRQPPLFEEAVASFEDGALRAALQSFETLISGDNGSGKKLKKSELWCQEHSYYYAWKINRRMGRLGDAKDLEKKMEEAYPKSHYLPELKLADALDLYAFGDFAKAEAAFSKFIDTAKKRGFASRYKVMAAVGRARSLMGAKQISDAEAAVAAAAAFVLSEEDRLRSELVRGELLVAQKKIGAAQSLFQQIFDKVKDDFENNAFAFAGAANGLGDCLYASGKFEDAAFEYSKVFALFVDRGDLNHELGWAFWRFANCCKQLAAKLEGDPARVYTFRFRKNRDTAAEEYRLTRGGQLARREKGMSR